MPIYQYYCPNCHGRFKHLARQFDASSPPCPRCGNTEVERMVTSAAVLHSSEVHETQLKEMRTGLDEDNPQAVARFLQESGRLEDADGLYGSRAYRELLQRRAEGADDADLGDLVADLSSEAQDALSQNDIFNAATAASFSDEVGLRVYGSPPPRAEEEEHHATSSDSQSARSRRSADDLGWG